MDRNLSSRDKKFVESMLESAKKSAKVEPESKLPDQAEVEQLTKSIQARIQRGETLKK